MRKDRIYFVQHIGFIPPPFGGVTVHVKRLLLTLFKKGLPSIAFSKGNPVGIPAEYQKYFDCRYIKHLRSFAAVIEIPRMLKCFSKCKIIHNHYGVNTSFALLAVHKLLRIPAVFTIHNQMIDAEFASTNWFDRFCFKRLAEDTNVQVIAVNDKERHMLEDRGYKFANPITVIPAYIPPVEIGKPCDYLDNELVDFITASTQIILFYAESFAEYNGYEIYGTRTIVDIFISLKEELPNLKIVICISNPASNEGNLEYLKKRISEKGYSNDVYWQEGPIMEMWPLLKKSSVLVRPTCTDGDSIMIREALSFGLPVVASDVTIRPEGCTVYEFGNDNDLLEKTKAELLNPSKKYYPQPDYSEEIINIYHKLLSS